MTTMTKTEANEIAGSLSNPSKMPAYAYGLPAEECITGSKLVNVAGSVCENCYALKGFYKTYAKTVKPAQYKRLAAIDNPNWVLAMVKLIGDTKSEFFRWHDSGDLQSVAHLEKIAEIARALPNVRFWLPTREYAIVKEFLANNTVPKNLVIRLSAHLVDGPVPTIGKLNVSSVFSDTAPKGCFECPARKQNNECKDCRACWNPKVKHVSYHQH
jgi:hypothetical protein